MGSARALCCGPQPLTHASRIGFVAARTTILSHDFTCDEIGYLKIVACSPCQEASCNAFAVFCFTILAHFPLAFDLFDDEPKADDPAQRGLDKAIGRVGDSPRCGSAEFLLSRELGHMTTEPVSVLHHFGMTVGMYDRVIPSRHHPSMFGLRGVPGRRDVTLSSLENHERINSSRKIFPVRIGARQMTFDETISTVVLEDCRQVRGVETLRPRGDENAKWVSANECVHLFQIVLAKMFGLIHVVSRYAGVEPNERTEVYCQAFDNPGLRGTSTPQHPKGGGREHAGKLEIACVIAHKRIVYASSGSMGKEISVRHTGQACATYVRRGFAEGAVSYEPPRSMRLRTLLTC
jgi:hypothetical protein